MATALDVTDSDKWDLLEAIYKHGTDINTLLEVLPTWKKDRMEHILKRFKCRAKKKLQEEEKQNRTAFLNEWFQVMENLHQIQGSSNVPWWVKGRVRSTEEPKDHSLILSKALMYAALFEDHYESASPDDPNYSEIYMYLSQIVSGKEPTQLSPGSASKVLEVLGKIKNVISGECTLNNRKYLLNPELSYLKPKEAEGKFSNVNTAGDCRSKEISSEICPLFEEGVEEEAEEQKVIILDPDDPYYEVKKEMLAKKIRAKQLETIPNISSIPGFNPLEIPAELLVKPPEAILDPQSF